MRPVHRFIVGRVQNLCQTGEYDFLAEMKIDTIFIKSIFMLSFSIFEYFGILIQINLNIFGIESISSVIQKYFPL